MWWLNTRAYEKQVNVEVLVFRKLYSSHIDAEMWWVEQWWWLERRRCNGRCGRDLSSVGLAEITVVPPQHSHLQRLLSVLWKMAHMLFIHYFNELWKCINIYKLFPRKPVNKCKNVINLCYFTGHIKYTYLSYLVIMYRELNSPWRFASRLIKPMADNCSNCEAYCCSGLPTPPSAWDCKTK